MQVFYVSSGLLEVQPHIVTVLAEYAENAVNLDEAAAIHAREASLRAWQNGLSDRECAQTLAQATAQLQAIDRLRRIGSKLGK